VLFQIPSSPPFQTAISVSNCQPEMFMYLCFRNLSQVPYFPLPSFCPKAVWHSLHKRKNKRKAIRTTLSLSDPLSDHLCWTFCPGNWCTPPIGLCALQLLVGPIWRPGSRLKGGKHMRSEYLFYNYLSQASCVLSMEPRHLTSHPFEWHNSSFWVPATLSAFHFFGLILLHFDYF
jgi:hypothetical protein